MTFIHIGENVLHFSKVRLHRVLSIASFGDLLCEIVLVAKEFAESGLAIRVSEVDLVHGSVNAFKGSLHGLFAHASSDSSIHDKPPYNVKRIDGWMGEEAYASSPYSRSYSLLKKSSNICSKVSPHSSASSCKSVSFWQAASYATHGLPVSISMLQSVCSKSYSAEFMAHVRLSHCGIFFAAQQWYSSRTCPQSNLLPCIWYCLTYFTISSACSANSILIAFCLSCSLVLIAYTMVLPILYIYLTVSSQLSVCLSAVGDGLPYGLHRTSHVLPSRPLCGAGARLRFNFQGAMLSGVQPLSGRSYIQEDSPWFCLCPLDILNCTTRLSVCQEFFLKNLDFFSLALQLALHCSVGQFLILIIAAISEMSSKFFPNSKKNIGDLKCNKMVKQLGGSNVL